MIPRRINQKWILQKKNWLAVTSKSDPKREDLSKEISDAEAELNLRNKFENYMKRNHGYIMNTWPLKAAGVTYDSMSVFFRKVNGITEVMSVADAWKLFQEHNHES